MEKLAKIIGVGRGGIKVVEQFEQHGFCGNVHYSILALSRDRHLLEETSIQKKQMLDTIVSEKVISVNPTVEGRLILETNIDNVTKSVGRVDSAIIVAGLGGEASFPSRRRST